MSNRSFREVYEGKKSPLPELRLVGWTRYTSARVPGLTAHRHKDVFEIFFLERGSTDWWVEDEVQQLRAGSVWINRPGEIHGSVGPSLRPCGYFWIQLAFSKQGLPGMEKKESMELQKNLGSFRERTFLGSQELRHAFEMLWEESRQKRFLRALSARAWLHILLARLLRDYRSCHSPQNRKRPFSFAVREVIREMETSSSEITSLDALGKRVGLKPTRFRERFLEETGFTPADYLRRVRIEKGKKLLKSCPGTAITTIAHECGFSSSQHFATLFKRVEGLSPSLFRQLQKTGV